MSLQETRVQTSTFPSTTFQTTTSTFATSKISNRTTLKSHRLPTSTKKLSSLSTIQRPTFRFRRRNVAERNDESLSPVNDCFPITLRRQSWKTVSTNIRAFRRQKKITNLIKNFCVLDVPENFSRMLYKVLILQQS